MRGITRGNDFPESSAYDPGFSNDIVFLPAAVIASPGATLLGRLGATYALNVAPYTRYQSNGTALVPSGGGAGLSELAFTGAVDGVNAVFVAASTPVFVSLNGQILKGGGVGYTLVGATATFTVTPVAGDIIQFFG